MITGYIRKVDVEFLCVLHILIYDTWEIVQSLLTLLNLTRIPGSNDNEIRTTDPLIE